MTNPPIIYFDDMNQKEKIEKSLKIMKEFSGEEFFAPSTRDYITKKLGLDEDFWKNFRNTIWENLKNFGFVVVKGIPFDENNRLYFGIASIVGTPIMHNKKVKEAVREITPRTGDMPLENYPHTDSPHFPVPNDLITLQCGREDQERDVFSRIVHINSVLEELRDSKDLVKRLKERKYPFLLSPDFEKGSTQMQPVLTQEKYAGKIFDHVRFCRADTIDCIKNQNIQMEVEDMKDLEELENIATRIGEKTQFPFKKDDWLVFDNKVTFHSKTETSPNTVRMLKKMKLNIDRDKVYSN
jgi:hypothetical protein